MSEQFKNYPRDLIGYGPDVPQAAKTVYCMVMQQPKHFYLK